MAYFAWLAIQQARADWAALIEPRIALDTILAVASLSFLGLMASTYWSKPGAGASRSDWPALITTFLAIDALGLAGRLPVTQPDAWVMCASLTLAGTCLAAWAVASLGSSFSLLPQARELVTSGPYAIVRHPIYLGGFLIALGELWLRWSVAAVALSVAFSIAQIVRLRMEERLLIQSFDDYAEYRRSTSALLPGVY